MARPRQFGAWLFPGARESDTFAPGRTGPHLHSGTKLRPFHAYALAANLRGISEEVGGGFGWVADYSSLSRGGCRDGRIVAGHGARIRGAFDPCSSSSGSSEGCAQ